MRVLNVNELVAVSGGEKEFAERQAMERCARAMTAAREFYAKFGFVSEMYGAWEASRSADCTGIATGGKDCGDGGRDASGGGDRGTRGGW